MAPNDRIVEAHDQTERDLYIVHYDDHVERKESAQFRATKRKLTQDLGLGCAVCLARNLKTLITEGKLPASPGDCKLPSGVKVHPYAWYFRKAGELGLYPKNSMPVESHHFAIEWALSNNSDIDKLNWFAEWMDPYGLYAEGKASGRGRIMTPDDDRTQLILCSEDHREEGEGIHQVPWPAWSAQFAVKDKEIVLTELKSDPTPHQKK